MNTRSNPKKRKRLAQVKKKRATSSKAKTTSRRRKVNPTSFAQYPTGGQINNYIQTPKQALDKLNYVQGIKRKEAANEMNELNQWLELGVGTISLAGDLGAFDKLGESLGLGQNMGEGLQQNIDEFTEAQEFCGGGRKKAFGGTENGTPWWEKFVNKQSPEAKSRVDAFMMKRPAKLTFDDKVKPVAKPMSEEDFSYANFSFTEDFGSEAEFDQFVSDKYQEYLKNFGKSKSISPQQGFAFQTGGTVDGDPSKKQSLINQYLNVYKNADLMRKNFLTVPSNITDDEYMRKIFYYDNVMQNAKDKIREARGGFEMPDEEFNMMLNKTEFANGGSTGDPWYQSYLSKYGEHLEDVSNKRFEEE